MDRENSAKALGDVSRRGFVLGSAAATVGAAAFAGVSQAKAEGQGEAGSDVSRPASYEVYNTDVCIIGGGLAGVALVSGEGENLVAPLPNFPVVRDLIVDKTKVTDRVAATMRRQRAKALTAEDLAVPVDPELYAKMDPLEHCSRCCVCTANCPVVAEKGLKKFAGPTQLIAIALRHYDPYDQGDRVIEAVQAGLFECIQCGACDEVCKALEIDHLGTWADLRAAAEERGLA